MTPLLYPHSTQHNKTSLSLSLSLSLFHELTHSVAHALFQIWRSHITLSFKRYAFFSLAIFFFFVWSPHSPKICFFLIALWMQASSVSSCCFTLHFFQVSFFSLAWPWAFPFFFFLWIISFSCYLFLIIGLFYVGCIWLSTTWRCWKDIQRINIAQR